MKYMTKLTIRYPSSSDWPDSTVKMQRGTSIITDVALEKNCTSNGLNL